MKMSGINDKSRRLLAEVLRGTKGTVTVAEVQKILGISALDAAKKLARWAEQGWFLRVRRGLYIPVPLESRFADIAIEDPWVIAERLFSPCYIGGWSAAEYWNLTEQIFKTLLVFTTAKVKARKLEIKDTSFLVRTITQKRFFGTRSIWRGQVKVSVSDSTKTIVDMLIAPSLGGGIRPVIDVFKKYLSSEYKDTNLLIEYAKRAGNGAVFKRLGFIVERIAPDEEALINICRKNLSAGNARLDPDIPSTRLLKRWNLWIPERWEKEFRFD